jgi:hypothetical protein
MFILSCSNPTSKKKILTIERPAFSFQYFSDWKIDTSGENYNSDALFSVKTKDESNSVLFIIFNTPIDIKEMLDGQKSTVYEKLIKNRVSTTRFTEWGKFKGEGFEVKGKLMGVFMGTIREFIWKDNTRTLFVMEEFYDKNFDEREKDFRLIRGSFTFK